MRHCLEKNPEERFESARDVAFDLESLSSVSTQTGAVLDAGRVEAIALDRAGASRRGGRPRGGPRGRIPRTARRRATFRRRTTSSSRSGAARSTRRASRPTARPSSTRRRGTASPSSSSRPARTAPSRACSASSARTCSRSRRPARWRSRSTATTTEPFIRSGTLAEVGVSGGVAPREIHKDVQWADWGPDGKDLAVVRDVNLRNQLEFPAGKVLYQTAGWISHPRVSPDGNLVAFLDHPQRGDDGGSVAVVDRAGKEDDARRGVLARSTASRGRRTGRRSGSPGRKVGGNRAIHAVSLDGERAPARPGDAEPHAPGRVAGRARRSSRTTRSASGSSAGREGQAKEKRARVARLVVALRPVATTGRRFSSRRPARARARRTRRFIRGTDGSPPVRLGEGGGQALSPDGQWAAVQVGRAKRTHHALSDGGRREEGPRDG